MAAVEAAAAAAAGVPAKHRQEYTGEAMESMTMTELVKVAQGKGLDTKKAKKKADVIALILGADDAQEATEPAAAADLPRQSEGRDDAAAQEEQLTEEHSDGPETIGGRVLVVYTGMVNLRDMDGNVDDLAMQGQTFPVCGRLVRDGATWYRITDREKKLHLISAEVVRYME